MKKCYPFLAGFGTILLFLATRFYNILSLPIFTDEAIYIRWAQIAGTDSNQRFISLTDGKQPSFVWIAAAAMRLIHDPLLAGRMVSVGAGLVSLVGIFFLTTEIFKNKKIGFIASFLYVLFPFSLVYDRLALYDSLVAAFIIWSLYFEILLVRRMRLDLALILGMIIGGGMLTKTNANFALILLPFSLLLFSFKEKYVYKRLLRWAMYALVVSLIAVAMYSILRLSPFYHIISDKNLVFIYSPSDWIHNPLAYFSGNFKGLFGWLMTYVTVPFFILVISSFLVGKKYIREKVLLLSWFIVPFIALALFGKVIYPRFMLFMTMPLLALAAYALYYLTEFSQKIWLKGLVVIVFVLMFVVNDFFILSDFSHANVPESDKNQFLSSWPSGVGVEETVKFLKERSKSQKIYVGTEGTFGLMPYALEIYFHGNKDVVTQGFWPINDIPPAEVLSSASHMPTFFVFYQPCPSCVSTGVAPKSWPVEKIFQIPKMEKGSYYTLYQIKPQ